MLDKSPSRPGPLRWVWYAYGGQLPERYREWVLHDITCRTWVLRHFARSLVQLAPGLLFLLLPGPRWIVVMGLCGGVFMALWFSLAYMEHTCEHRLVKHGYSLGTGRAVRDEANAEQRAREAAEYRAAWRPDAGNTEHGGVSDR